MANALSKEELIAKRTELETEVNAKQEELAAAKYSVDFESLSNIKAVLKQMDSAYRWNIKNAALTINLYDSLKVEKIAIQKSGDESAVVNLTSLDLNTLYQVLTNIDGTGIESARTFVKLLTNVGAQITEAMNEMAEANRSIQSLHVALGELDAEIEALSKETVEADEISQ
jgi:hypothetical protein